MVQWFKKADFKQGVALIVVGGIITLFGNAGLEGIKEVLEGPAQITCSAEYEAYGELLDKYPRSALVQDADDEVEKQCAINEFMKKVHPEPDQVGPANSEESP